MNTHLATVAVCLVLAACASAPIIDRSNYEDVASNEPAFGQQAEVPPGGTMFRQYSYWHRAGARITVSNRQPFGLGGLFISRDDVVYPSTLNGVAVYCSEKRLYSDPIAGFVSKACFSDRNSDGVFDAVRVAPEESAWIERPLSPPLPYTKMDIPVAHRGAFKYEIAYAGYSNQSMQLSYREFSGEDLIRPLYSERVNYHISSFPAEIKLRSVRIQILKADNDGVRYTVLSGF